MKKTVLAVLTAGAIAVSSQALAVLVVHDVQQSVKTAAQWLKGV